MSNLRQIGLALHGYEGASGCLPPGRLLTYDPRYAGPNPPCTSPIVDKGVPIFLLNHLEQPALFHSINHDVSILARENRTIQAVVVGSLACPSDPASGVPRVADSRGLVALGLADSGERIAMVFISYSAFYGDLMVDAVPRPEGRCRITAQVANQANGSFNDLSPIRFADIGDGLSNTLFVGEKDLNALRSLGRVDPGLPDRAGWWVTGNWGDTLLTSMYPPNMIDRVSIAAGQSHYNAASSAHPGGVNVLFGDGSVRFLKDTIDSWPVDNGSGTPSGARRNPGGWWERLPVPGLWQKLATRSGGEVGGTIELY